MDLTLFVTYLAACGAAAATGALFPPGDWYRTLAKPVWTPPDWMFPVAWMSLYLLMSAAAARMAGVEGSGLAMALWAVQIGFNTLWSPVFFGLRRMRAALAVIAVLWSSVAAMTVLAFGLDFWAGVMLVPYLVWVTVAGALNLRMVQLNPAWA